LVRRRIHGQGLVRRLDHQAGCAGRDEVVSTARQRLRAQASGARVSDASDTRAQCAESATHGGGATAGVVGGASTVAPQLVNQGRRHDTMM